VPPTATSTNTPIAEGTTTTTVGAAAGDTSIVVASAEGFAVGDVISIGASGAGSSTELNQIAGIGGATASILAEPEPGVTLLLECPLQFPHAAGAVVSETEGTACGDPATNTPTATSTSTKTPVPTTTSVTKTPAVTRTVEPEPDCMTFREKLRAAIQIIRRWGAKEGGRKYNDKWDFNDDGKINGKDIKFLIDEIPLCPPRGRR
jgi:hypothetical protein